MCTYKKGFIDEISIMDLSFGIWLRDDTIVEFINPERNQL
jgi:hypothetical protein